MDAETTATELQEPLVWGGMYWNMAQLWSWADTPCAGELSPGRLFPRKGRMCLLLVTGHWPVWPGSLVSSTALLSMALLASLVGKEGMCNTALLSSIWKIALRPCIPVCNLCKNTISHCWVYNISILSSVSQYCIVHMALPSLSPGAHLLSKRAFKNSFQKKKKKFTVDFAVGRGRSFYHGLEQNAQQICNWSSALAFQVVLALMESHCSGSWSADSSPLGLSHAQSHCIGGWSSGVLWGRAALVLQLLWCSCLQTFPPPQETRVSLLFIFQILSHLMLHCHLAFSPWSAQLSSCI